MPLSSEEIRGWDLPRWREILELVDSTEIQNVKFYPYAGPTEDPIFAAVGGNQLLICRPTHVENRQVEVIQAVIDEEPSADNCCVAWAKADNGSPLLCIAGKMAVIKVINALTGEIVQALPGHGGAILDLAVSRTNPQVLASCSEDHTIRLWSLKHVHKESPCVALLAGEGHLDSVLSIDFHTTGQYLLSGGQDHIVNLWMVPELPDGISVPERAQVIHYPHFSTSEVHSNKVDCVAFYHDLILSKAHTENCIVLWQIMKFSSSAPSPSVLAAPTTHDQRARTRSAFFKAPEGKITAPRLYQRLLQFELPSCNQLYMRFSLHNPLSSPQHHVLAICNSLSKVLFWDLSRLVEYQKFIAAPSGMPRPHWLTLKSCAEKNDISETSHLHGHIQRDESAASSSVNTTLGTETLATPLEIETNCEAWDEKYAMGDPWRSLKAHKVESIPRVTTAGRAVAWSDNGEFCVVVGSPNIISVLERWAPEFKA